MSGKEREKIEARLRKNRDADLRQATAGISAGELSEMVRDGLRYMLGIRTKKTIQIVEQPIVAQQPRPIPVAGKSAVFRPNNQSR
ncbi:hypothetical protein [Paenibacillus sp.]|uniref:hypothetical protein n=1 Tax=Paenibacillus sp. TaxID=58172 RepID=UPI002D4AF440|nr:hypothetical protein [Paenibacillus sp.]HZG83816.1 hypothetical protein [Paenibacillus sp.]